LTGRDHSPTFPKKHLHAKQWFEPCRKSAVRGSGGEGGDPPTPPPLFFKVGVTPPPMCRARWGVPPSPTSARTGEPPHSGEMPENPVPRRRLHAKRRFEPCRKSAVCGLGGEGGDPPTPPPLFFKVGVTPPTHVPGQVGGTPCLSGSDTSPPRLRAPLGARRGECGFPVPDPPRGRPVGGGGTSRSWGCGRQPPQYHQTPPLPKMIRPWGPPPGPSHRSPITAYTNDDVVRSSRPSLFL
jgi:hypothetical protein